MKQLKPALTQLEQAILRLESAIYASKKTQVQLEEQVLELKQTLQKTHDRLNTAIETYKQEIS